MIEPCEQCKLAESPIPLAHQKNRNQFRRLQRETALVLR